MIRRPTLSITISLLLLGMLASSSSAQTVVFNMTRAEMYCTPAGNRTIRVLFDTSLKRYLDEVTPDSTVNCALTPDSKPCKRFKAVKDLLEGALAKLAATSESTSFYLLELKSGTKYSLKDPAPLPDFLDQEALPEDRARPPVDPLNDSHLTLGFTAPTGLVVDPTYVVVANVERLEEGSKKGNPHIIKVEPQRTCGEPMPKVIAKLPDAPEPKDVRDLLIETEKAKSANLGVSFGLSGSKRNRIYSHEIAFQPWKIHKPRLGGYYDIIPFFLEHKFARDKKSPKDDFKFGFKVNHLLLLDPVSDDGVAERDLLKSIQTTLSAQVESDFLFSDQVNLIGEWRSGLPINLFGERSTVARITPFIGYSVGRVIKDESPIRRNRILSRGIFGVDVFLALGRKEKTNPFEIDINYIRRVLARPEAEYFVNADGKEVFGGYSRSPKDFVKSRLTFNYNDKIAPFFQYTWGREPGKYVLQNSVMEAGLKVYMKWQ